MTTDLHRWPTGRMATLSRILPFFLVPIIFFSHAAGEPLSLRFSSFDFEFAFEADGSPGPFRVSDQPVFEGSGLLWVDGARAIRDVDYAVNDASGSVTFYSPPPRGSRIVFRGRREPDVLPTRVYRVRQISEVSERIVASGPGRRIRVSSSTVTPSPGRSATDAARLRIGGVKRLQVEVGSSQTVTQSLRLEMAGELAEGIELQALLTDRNLPLRSGGQTRGLDELDRVLFRVTSPTASAGVGDLEVDFDGSTFGRYRRRLQGVQVTGEHAGYRFEGFGAVARGRRVSRRIAAIHGYQGPYRVGSTSRELAGGSERVYVDGRRLRRGEGQDYVIDYDRGQITFTASQPIVGESQITVDVQTLNPQDRGRLLGFQGGREFGPDGRIGTTFLREAGVAEEGGGPRQVLAVDAATSVHGFRLAGEVGLSGSRAGSDARNGRAVRLGVSTESQPLGRRGAVRLSANYQDIGESFDAMDRVTRVNEEGRWGWRPESDLLTGRVAEVGAHYADVSGLGLRFGFGRRSGLASAQRLAASASFDRGSEVTGKAAVSRLTQEGGSLAVHTLEVERRAGVFRPSMTLRDETGRGTSVGSSSLFYAGFGRALPEGIRRRDGRLEMVVGSARRSLTSTMTVTRIDQWVDAWRDSTTTVAHHHRAVIGTRSGLNATAEVGRTWRRDVRQGTSTSDVGRVRLGYTPAGGAVSQQLTYRIATTGVNPADAAYEFVGPGRGSYLWEDVDGDGEQDAEEFVFDRGGDYELALPDASLAVPLKRVREATVGARVTIDPARVWRNAEGLARWASMIAYEGAIESRRQMTGDGGLAPWSLGLFRDDDAVWAARREVRSTFHLFRRSRVASFRLDERREHRLDRALSDDGRSERLHRRLEGRFRFGRRFDLETYAEGERRLRMGEGPFAHVIRSRTLRVRGLMRLTSGWQTGLSMTVGKDVESTRAIEADRLSVGPEFRKPLAGRGRLTGRAGWTHVEAGEVLPLFLGLADGNRRGNNLDWRMGFDYRLSSYLTAYASYDGRLRPERPLLHFGRMEMRASF